ncbi:MAG: hypothetical protein HYR93_00360 [Chloroflexi bacterium]|nr:hypothetical protein [Chloroflexota bacterium]MBI2759586.1 hypothetical protein [Chloroflexota bacterium]
MHIGMLWFDNAPDIELKIKIEKAVAYYRQKYHREPNLCLIHPDMLNKEKLEFAKITIRSYRPVLPGHMWIGIEDKSQ